MEKDTSTSALRGHRTLATVVFTDCVGFSARMSVDENHTLKLIHRDLKLMKRMCEQFEGRVLKSTGDGLLMHFISAVKAVECAIAIQKTLTETAATLPPADALQHRIGIHLADIFITNTDVMGNGVNIAARLQATADPSGICISQTVYDVVKAGLQLETRYMGPRELKNIREVIPVYKILLEPEADALEPYTDIARSLEQHPNAPRIRKLLYYVCRNVWESDQTRLDGLDLRELLRQLIELAPSSEQLPVFLEAAVKTLSKQAEYTIVANNILEEALGRLYPQFNEALSEVHMAANARSPGQPGQRDRYERVALELDQTGNGARIRKLMFYVCRNRWESDQQRLNQLSLPDLLAELHQAAPSLEQLRGLLGRYVQTLSKQTEYALVANIICDRLQPLYQSGSVVAPDRASPSRPLVAPVAASDSLEQQYAEIAQALEVDLNRSRIKKLMLYVCQRHWETNPARLETLPAIGLVQDLHRMSATAQQLEFALFAVVKTLNKQTEYMAIARTIINKFARLYPGYQAPAAPPQPTPAPAVLDEAPQVPTNPNAAIPSTPPNPVLDRASNPTPTPEVTPEAPPEATPDPSPAQPPDPQTIAILSLFDIRLEVMKYANPLRAKILLFSAVYEPFGYTSQDWMHLKQHDLMDLLRQVLRRCPVYTDLERLLYGVARQLPDLEEMVKTAEVVIRQVRSLYVHGMAAIVVAQADPTQISNGAIEDGTRHLAGVELEDQTCQLGEQTCQLTNQTRQLEDQTRQTVSSEPESTRLLASPIDENTATRLSSPPPATETRPEAWNEARNSVNGDDRLQTGQLQTDALQTELSSETDRISNQGDKNYARE